jgi:hypothetical protein
MQCIVTLTFLYVLWMNSVIWGSIRLLTICLVQSDNREPWVLISHGHKSAENKLCPYLKRWGTRNEGKYWSFGAGTVNKHVKTKRYIVKNNIPICNYWFCIFFHHQPCLSVICLSVICLSVICIYFTSLWTSVRLPLLCYLWLASVEAEGRGEDVAWWTVWVDQK